MKFLLLHGFLGAPGDWGFHQNAWGPGAQAIDLLSLMEDPDGAVENSLSRWAQRFLAGVEQLDFKPVILGYSLGGRLALHALRQKPELFSAAVIVSAHPGLSLPSEKEARLASDEAWARRFETESLSVVLRDWNRQEVFRGSSPREVDSRWDPRLNDGKRIAAALRSFSLGRQEDLRGVLESLPIPLLWITGEKDPKFCALARGLEGSLGRRSQAEVWIAPGAGHRVPWDAPQGFLAEVNRFLTGIQADQNGPV